MTCTCRSALRVAWVALSLLVLGGTSDNANVALSERGTRAFASTFLSNHDADRILDGNMLSGWAFQSDEVDNASVIIVFRQMVAANRIRIFSGVGGGHMISRFRLYFTSSLPENVSDPEFIESTKWREMHQLTADAEGVDVMDGTVFTLRQDVLLAMPLMLVRGIKVVVEDTHGDTFGALLNEIQVLVPLQHNPGIQSPHGTEFPAKQYIWPLYNVSDDAAEDEEEDEEYKQRRIWFEWHGPLHRNETVVFGLLQADVEVHNFAVPEEGHLELYFQTVLAAQSVLPYPMQSLIDLACCQADQPRILFSVMDLHPGLHVITVRLRDRQGHLLPDHDRRAVFVNERPPTHPWLLRHRVEAVGDGLWQAHVGAVTRFRLHILERKDARPSGGAEEEAGGEGEASGDEGGSEGEGGGDADREEEGGEGEEGAAVGREEWSAPWEEADPEFFTVTLRGPSVVSGRVKRVGAGVYDGWYTVFDPGHYELAVVLHYAGGGGLRNPGVGGQEDVVEHMVGGGPWEVEARAEGLRVCYRNGSEGEGWRDPQREDRVCGREEAGTARGRWVHRAQVCGGRVGEAAGGKGGCEVGDEGDQWAWAPVGCKYRKYSPLEAQECLEERGRRVLVAGASPQRTLFFDLADLVFPGEIATSKAHQDLEFPPVAFFHWIPYHVDSVPGCPLDCQLDYGNVTWHVADFVSRQGSGGADVLVVQAGIHDIFFGSLETFSRNIVTMARMLRRIRRETPVDALYRFGDMLHLPRGGDIGLVEHGFRSQRMVAALRRARRVMEEAGVPVLDTLQTTLGRPEGTADGYHFNEWACMEDTFRGNALSRTNAHILMNRACN